MMACIIGEENRDTINKAKWRTHFIGIKQYWGESYGQGVKRVVMQKLSLGVISSTDSWKWEDVNRKWFFENGIVREFQLEKMFVHPKGTSVGRNKAGLIVFPLRDKVVWSGTGSLSFINWNIEVTKPSVCLKGR